MMQVWVILRVSDPYLVFRWEDMFEQTILIYSLVLVMLVRTYPFKDQIYLERVCTFVTMAPLVLVQTLAHVPMGIQDSIAILLYADICNLQGK